MVEFRLDSVGALASRSWRMHQTIWPPRPQSRSRFPTKEGNANSCREPIIVSGDSSSGARCLVSASKFAWDHGNTHGYTGREVNPLPYGRAANFKNAGRLPALRGVGLTSIFAWLIL